MSRGVHCYAKCSEKLPPTKGFWHHRPTVSAGTADQRKLYPDAPLEVLALGLFHFLVRLEHFVVGGGRHAVHAPSDGGGEDFLLIFIGSPQLAGRGPDEACLVLNVAHPSVPFSGVQRSPELKSQLESERVRHSRFENRISLIDSAKLSIMEFGGLFFEKVLI